MRLLVTGAGGLLGANLALEALDAGWEVVASARRELRVPGGESRPADLLEEGAAEALVRASRAQAVIHCAALTNVDECEERPERALALNAEAAGRLAAAARDAGARLLFISTDSVFDGKTGGYGESSTPAPVNAYARSKLEGERAVAAAHPEALVVRTNFFGWDARGKAGLAHWLLSRLEAGRAAPGFADVVFNPLLANDLARALLELAGLGTSGLLHVAGADSVSKHEFGRRLAQAFGLDASLVEPARLADAGLKAPRPRDTTLRTDAARALLGRPLPGLEAGLKRFRSLRDGSFRERLAALAGDWAK